MADSSWQRTGGGLLALSLLVSYQVAFAQVANSEIISRESETVTVSSVIHTCQKDAGASVPCIPALTPIRLVVRAQLGSNISTSGQTFPIELAAPIMVDGEVLVPAGTAGMGEVVHAKNSGGSGASGELILAARYLTVGGRRLRLRSMNFAVTGKDATGTVNSISIASAATMPMFSLIGFFVKGQGIAVPAGAEAFAKTAEAFVLDPPVAALPQVSEATPVL